MIIRIITRPVSIIIPGILGLSCAPKKGSVSPALGEVLSLLPPGGVLVGHILTDDLSTMFFVEAVAVGSANLSIGKTEKGCDLVRPSLTIRFPLESRLMCRFKREISGAPGRSVWPSTTTPDLEMGVKVRPATVKTEEMVGDKDIVVPSMVIPLDLTTNLFDGASDMTVPDSVIALPPAESVTPATRTIEGLMTVISRPAADTVAEAILGSAKV